MMHAPDFAAPAPRTLCTDCGVSRMAIARSCGTACQFIKPDYPAMEGQVHGRARDPARPDELHFGPFRRMLRARLTPPREGAQWTGIATRLGERLLETGAVDAVLTMAPDPEDRWKPVPVLVTLTLPKLPTSTTSPVLQRQGEQGRAGRQADGHLHTHKSKCCWQVRCWGVGGRGRGESMMLQL